MDLIEPRNFSAGQFNIVDVPKFQQAMKLLCESLFDKGATLFASDNIITWNRNLSFLREDFFTDYLKDDKNTFVEKSIVWRLYVLLYFAKIASHADGDFVELGCHTGNSAANVIKKVDLPKLGKKYFLYDLFAWNEGDAHSPMPGHANKNMYEDVVKRFEPFPFVSVTRGSVPETLENNFPDKIAFAHVDMNHPAPEAGALKKILPRLSKGGVIIFDDYGWWGYSAQKMALDPILKDNGYDVLELPTGQAVLIKT